MNRRTFVTVGGALLGLSAGLRAQVQGATRRIGILSGFPLPAVELFLTALRPELEKLGWVEGRNFVFLETRTTEGANDRLPFLTAELVSQRPDLILVQSGPVTRALMQATKSIPIVMVGVGAPVDLGFVADYGKPGGNVTGSSYPADECIRKLMQFLKEMAPRLRSVAVFSNPNNEAAGPMNKQVRADAVTFGIQVQIVDVSAKSDFETAFAAIRRANSESIVLPPEPLIRSNSGAISAFAQAHALPLAVVGTKLNLPQGGLISYGPPLVQFAQNTARYVDRIFKGAKPGDLPVEQPTRLELVINKKVASALGLTIPQTLLLLADEVIQ